VVAAGTEWLVTREKGETLCDVLERRGLLDGQRRRLVEALVDEAIASAGGDPYATFDTLTPAMKDSLNGLSATLRSTTGETARADLSFDSLETPENVGSEARGRYTFDTGRDGTTQELGRGGVGQVLVARDHFLGRDIAFKALHRDLTTSSDVDTMRVHQLESRFLREARVTAQLDHPAIVPVYELGRRADGTLYYTMQRVRGRTLAQALADGRTLAGRLTFVPDLLAATQAVASAHHRHVIHRDLKPQNVMLGIHGETYVMDWGLARVIGRPERQARPLELAPDLTAGRDLGPVGTPSYMSPEQAWCRPDEVDERSDVWGLGAMMFELLTGRAPYVGRSPWDVLADVRSAPVPKVQQLEPDAPPELVAICEKALSRERAHRYASGAELAADLAAWVQGRRVSAYQYTAREVLRRLAVRHRALAGVLTVLGLALLAAGFFSAVAVRQERDEARAMARFFLNDVSPTLARAPGATRVFDQLATSALEAFSEGLDLQRGAREDRLLLARTWNTLAALNWRLGRREAATRATVATRALLEPLRREADDPAVLAEWVFLVTSEADLLLDEGRDDEARGRLESLTSTCARLALLEPDGPTSLRARALVAARLGLIGLNNPGGHDSARVSLRVAASLAERWREVAPGDDRASSALTQSLVYLGTADLVDNVPRGLAELQRAVSVAREARAATDTVDVRRGLATALTLLGEAQVGRDDVQAAVTLTEARSVITSLALREPGELSLQAGLIEVELLLGRPDEAWALARQLDASAVGGEFEVGVVLAAFSAGEDAAVLSRLKVASALTRDAATCYGALVEALANRPRQALSLALACEASGALERELWLSKPLAARARSARGPVGAALVRLAADLPTALSTRAESGAAWGRFVGVLREAAR
jgi:tRNA A-37 threonylcarbamoyl transferase component Bud32